MEAASKSTFQLINKVRPFRFWNLRKNQQEFLENVALKLGISQPSDWGKVTKIQFKQHGGSTLLVKFGSLSNVLRNAYPNIEFKNSWFVNRQTYEGGFWKSENNQREYLDNLAIKLNIKHPKDWFRTSVKELKKIEGFHSLLTLHNGSLKNLLTKVYPETKWEEEWFSLNRKWEDLATQREFLQNIAKELNIQSPEEWSKVTAKNIYIRGGTALLRHFGSLSKALQKVFPELNWKTEWFAPMLKSGHWKNRENERKFFDGVAKKLKIKTPKDWGRIPVKVILHNGGGGLLFRYNKSLYKALRSAYPETVWKREWFVNIPLYKDAHWFSVENQKLFLEDLAIQLNLQKPEDWKRISLNLIKKKGGAGLLRRYENCIYSALHTIYGENSWSISSTTSKDQGDITTHVAQIFK